MVYDGKFPVIVDTQYFYMTLQDAGGLIDPEVVKIIAHTPGSNSVTVVRGQDDTVAKDWALGTTIGMRDNAAVFGELRAGILAVDAKIEAPVSVIWRVIPVQNWTVGDVVSFQLSDYAISPDGSPISYQTTSGALPDSLTLDEDTGEILGTIFPVQGGTYETAVAATNASGIPIPTVLPALVVGLEPVAPTLGTVPDVSSNVGSLLATIDMNDYVTDDGIPGRISVVTFSYTYSLVQPAGITFAEDGIISGEFTTEALVNTITVTATNDMGLESTTQFTITVAAAAGEQGLLAGFYRGQLACSASVIVPTWSATTNFFVQVGQVVSIDMISLSPDGYIASLGGGAITAMALGGASAALPTGLNTTDTMGFVKGTVGAGTAGSYALTFTADNSAGQSLESGVFPMTVWDVSTEVPTLDTVDALADASYFYLNFSTPMTATDYNAGLSFLYNGTSTSYTYISGGGTARIKYMALAGVVFSGQNTITFALTSSESTLVSVDSGLGVIDTIVTHTVSAPNPVGVYKTEDFENFSTATDSEGFRWSSVHNAEVVTDNPHTGTKSMRFKFRGGGAEILGARSSISFRQRPVHDFWCKYYIYFPDGTENFPTPTTGSAYRRRTAGTHLNHKWFLTWNADPDGPKNGGENMGASTYPNSSTSFKTIGSYIKYDSINGGVVVNNYYDNQSIITSQDLGRWTEFIHHYRSESASGAANGIFQIYKNGALFVDQRNITNYQSHGYNDKDAGYILGAANDGFVDDTYIYIDDITFSSSPLI